METARFVAVKLGYDGYAVMDRETGHFVRDSAYSIREMADAKADRLNGGAT